MGMMLKALTLPFVPALGGFDPAPIEALVRQAEILEATPAFFERGGTQYCSPEQQQPEQPQQQRRPASCEHDPRSVAGRSRTPGAYAGCPGIHPAPAASCAHGHRAGCIGCLPGKEQGAPGFVTTPLGGEHPGASGVVQTHPSR
jgi:hypothetical protein